MINRKYLLIFLTISFCAFAQEEKIELISGTDLNHGIGHIGDPTILHGLSLSMQGSLGVSSKSNTFGYDSLNVTGRWTPGTNIFGSKISILFGAANWFTPALTSIYPDEYLVESEKYSESSSVNALMAGLSLSFGKRIPDDKDWNEHKTEIDNFGINILGELNPLIKRDLIEKRDSYIWSNIIRPALRKPTLSVGGLFRLGALGTETDAEAYDIFLTGGIGKNIFDLAFSAHYLGSLSDELIADKIYTGTIGLFVDIDDQPPVRTFGLSGSIGYCEYNYREHDTLQTINPSSINADLTILISGIKGDSGGIGSGVGVRLSKLWHDETDSEIQITLLFTSDFLSIMKSKKD